MQFFTILLTIACGFIPSYPLSKLVGHWHPGVAPLIFWTIWLMWAWRSIVVLSARDTHGHS